MSSAKLQPKWDKYEAVLLLEAVLNVENGLESKRDSIRRVSSLLRTIANNRDLEINDTYRNISGISFQYQSMEFSAFGRENQTHKIGSKLFDEVVAMYKGHPNEYKSTLAAAHALADSSSLIDDGINVAYQTENELYNEKKFSDWLSSKGQKETSVKWIIDGFNQVSKYAIEKKLISCSLMSVTNLKEFNKDVNSIQSYKFFRVLKKDLYKFLLTNAKLYTSFLKDLGLKEKPKENCEQCVDVENFVISEVDKELFIRYSEKLKLVYSALKSNDRQVYLTIEQICSTTSITSDIVEEILKNASWAEKLSDGYILGHNNSTKGNVISFDVSKAFGSPTNIETILIENFRRGFRPGSIMDRNRFIALYEERYGIAVSEEGIINEVQDSCFKFDDRYFLPKALISKNIAQDIAEYISEYFSQKDILFYNVLFGAFEEKFESYIYSPEMLVSLLKKALIGTQVYYSDRYCSLQVNAMPDISSEVIDFLIQMDGPCSYDMIYGQLSHLNQKDIYNVLHYNNPEILGNSKVEYFHVKTAHLTDKELNELKNIAINLLKSSKFITCNEVMDNLEQSNHILMDRLKSKFTILGIRRIFTYYLRSDFDVDTGIVTNKGMKMTVIDAFADFATSRKFFTVDDVQNFSEYTGTVPYWDTIHRYAVRVNETEFVSDSDIDFDVIGIDEAIEYYCMDYIPLIEISDYSRFPSCGFAWNIFLLQQYVFRFSEKFKLLSLGFTKGNVSGVIVRKHSGFDDFDSVVIDALEKTKIIAPNDAIQYLCDKGFIAEKRYKKHAELLKVAIAHRNNR